MVYFTKNNEIMSITGMAKLKRNNLKKGVILYLHFYIRKTELYSQSSNNLEINIL